MRDATEDDLPRMVEMGRAFHAASSWAGVIDFNEADFVATVRSLLTSGIVLVSDTGMAGALIYPQWFNRREGVCQELFLWGDGNLLDGLVDRARARGATAFVMGDQKTLRPEAMARWLRRKGYRETESYYVKEL